MPLIRLFFDICLFRKGPQDAPASTMLLKLALLAYFLAGLVLTALEAPWLEGIAQVVLEGFMLFAFVGVSLLAAGKLNRWLQTVISLLGTDALITGFAIPLEGVLLAYPQAGLLHVLLLLLMLWHIGVLAHILRHALSQTLAVGLALAIVYVAFSVQVLVMLFGGPPTSS
jgi:hypothetical protein